MFRENTVFIIGAGASWHYGYPTGEGLVKKMRDYARQLRHMSSNLRHLGTIPLYIRHEIMRDEAPASLQNNHGYGWQKFAEECELLAEKLATVDPLVIDYFLGWNEGIRPVAKLILAMVLLEAEACYVSGVGNRNRVSGKGIQPITETRDNWYRFILYSLASGCFSSADIHNNNVKFVTFNYDTSLDYFLWRGLSGIGTFDGPDVDRFLGNDRITHIYGKIRDERATDFDHAAFRDLEKMRIAAMTGKGPVPSDSIFRFLDHAYRSTQNIRSISPQEKDQNGNAHQDIRKAIGDAAVVIILGYGFDENNNTRLGLKEALSYMKKKRVYFTNFDDNNLINKRAGTIMFHDPRRFLPPRSPIQILPEFYAERSTRNVYDALEQDFDCLEL